MGKVMCMIICELTLRDEEAPRCEQRHPHVRWCLALAVSAFLLLSSVAAQADQKRKVAFAFSPDHYDLQLHWKNGEDQFWTLSAVHQHLTQQGRCPVFLSNGGIYGKDYAPLGLHIEDGVRLVKKNPAKGRGNFSWNSGIFALRNGRAEVRRHSNWPGNRGVTVAAQSGPALVVQGKRTSAGRSDADRYSRGAIVVYRDGRVGFAHTLDRISFRDLVSLAATKGQVQGMLYLDGRINDWWDRSRTRSARGFPWFAGIFSVSRNGPCPDPMRAPRPTQKPKLIASD